MIDNNGVPLVGYDVTARILHSILRLPDTIELKVDYLKSPFGRENVRVTAVRKGQWDRPPLVLTEPREIFPSNLLATQLRMIA